VKRARLHAASNETSEKLLPEQHVQNLQQLMGTYVQQKECGLNQFECLFVQFAVMFADA